MKRLNKTEMNWQTILRNGFWLLVPVLIWNAIFSSKLAHPAFAHDKDGSQWLLILENLLRMAVFIVPLCLTLKWDTLQRKIGCGLYIAGILVYFASWIPLIVYPDSAWSNSLIGFTAPAFTPLIWLAGIGLIGGWWPYLGLSAVFVGVHLWHWSKVWKLVQLGVNPLAVTIDPAQLLKYFAL